MTATKCKTRILSLTILTLVAILAAFSPPFFHTPAYAQTSYDTPGAPTVTAIDHDSLRISWTPVARIPGLPPALYNLSYRAGTSGTWRSFGARPNTSSHVQNGLQPNTLYQWRVQAAGLPGAKWSGIGQGRTKPKPTPTPRPWRPSPPPRPSTPSVTALTHNSIGVSWSSVSRATGYDLRWRRDGTSSWTYAYSVSTGHSIPNLQPETRYEAQVRAKNSGGRSGWSASDRATTQPPPDISVSVTTVAQDIAGGSSVDLAATATDPLTQTLKYSWTADPTVGSFDDSKILTPKWTAPALATLSADQPVTLTLTVSGTYNRIKSGAVILTVRTVPGIPAAPTVSAVDHDSLKVEWNAPTSGGTPTSYDLRYKAAGGDNWTTVSDVTSGHVLNGLTPNTTYKVKVMAKNIAGTSAWSDKGKGTTKT